MEDQYGSLLYFVKQLRKIKTVNKFLIKKICLIVVLIGEYLQNKMLSEAVMA